LSFATTCVPAVAVAAAASVRKALGFDGSNKLPFLFLRPLECNQHTCLLLSTRHRHLRRTGFVHLILGLVLLRALLPLLTP
jgi:hypothetical protein